MALEIERKFLVYDETFKEMSTRKTYIWQGYLSTDPESTVRLRIADEKAFITVKSKNNGATRHEWEYEVPMDDAKEMKSICKASLEKTRYVLAFLGHDWEVDVYHGRHEGLIVAEIELKSESEPFTIPPFIGKEVTGDPKYYNSNLSKS